MNKTKIRGAEIEDIRQFTTFGSVISTSGGTYEDIQAEKKKTQQAFAQPLNHSEGAKPSEHQQKPESQLKRKISSSL